MLAQYDTYRVETTQSPLFTPADLHTILKENWGLRLSETLDSGLGDAIPLSHLGGAEDTIHFISLSAKVLKNSENLNDDEENISTLKKILITYVGHDYAHLDYAPALILVYASFLNLIPTPVSAALCKHKKLPSDEEEGLIKLYNISGGPLSPALVFDDSTPYYNDFPCLRLLLASDFNQLLEKRLKFNRFHYRSDTMYYSLITREDDYFRTGYGFNEYPLGKAGKSEFTHICHHKIEGQEIESIWNWLKQQCSIAPKPQPRSNTPRVLPPPATTPSYTEQCLTFCKENKGYMLGLLGFGFFVGYQILASTKDLSEDATPRYEG